MIGGSWESALVLMVRGWLVGDRSGEEVPSAASCCWWPSSVVAMKSLAVLREAKSDWLRTGPEGPTR